MLWVVTALVLVLVTAELGGSAELVSLQAWLVLWMSFEVLVWQVCLSISPQPFQLAALLLA